MCSFPPVLSDTGSVHHPGGNVWGKKCMEVRCKNPDVQQFAWMSVGGLIRQLRQSEKLLQLCSSA